MKELQSRIQVAEEKSKLEYEATMATIKLNSFKKWNTKSSRQALIKKEDKIPALLKRNRDAV